MNTRSRPDQHHFIHFIHSDQDQIKTRSTPDQDQINTTLSTQINTKSRPDQDQINIQVKSTPSPSQGYA
jgi:hypothetical protein